MNPSLAKALRIKQSDCVALVGSGGKSSILFNLARELISPVIVTSTTHLGDWQIQLADTHIVATGPALIRQLENKPEGVILITGEIEGDRTNPIDANSLTMLNTFCRKHSFPLLIEADGSRQKPLKAWADHEPPIPEFADLIVQVAGLNGLGKPLTDEFVHRADRYSRLSGVGLGENITSESLMKILTHENGGLKNMPPNARRSVILNQADDADTQSLARTMVDTLLHHYQSVLVSSTWHKVIHAVHEPVAGIILAAGGSIRFGEPKQVLSWKGEPFVRVVTQTAIRARLSPVILVTGAHADQVNLAVSGLNVRLINNETWESGQASSIVTGVAKIPDECGAAIFLLVDQPQVNTSILRALKDKHAEGLYPVVVPMVLDRRANPVLFDRTTFRDLMDIKGDTGGRAIFHKHRVEYLTWHDDSLLLDVDTPEQYQRLVSNMDI